MELVHINQLLENVRLPEQFQILCLPGGFSYGDDIAAGRILANQIAHHLRDVSKEFIQSNKLVLGICNGFQVLIKSGILLPDDERGPLATLTWNDTGRYEDRWVQVDVSSDRSVFLQGIESLYVPVAHAEGKFVARDAGTLHSLDGQGQLVLRYAGGNRRPGAARLSRESQRVPGQRGGRLRRDRPRIGIDAASGTAHRYYTTSPLDAGRGTTAGRRLAAVPQCGELLCGLIGIHRASHGWSRCSDDCLLVSA